MNVGSLFSGIGGIELGFEREGFSTSWFVENNPYCQEVLKHHFPHAKIYGDITELDFSKLPRVDILTGGFPCQDISIAGKQAGIKEGKRSSLWKYYAEAIRVLRPRFAVIENVPALISLGLDVVLADIAETGYDAEWFTLSASQFGAPHRRERIFIVAYDNDAGQHPQEKHSAEGGEQTLSEPELGSEPSSSADPSRIGAYQETYGKPHEDNYAYTFSVGCKSTGLLNQNDSGRICKSKSKQVFITDDWSERIQRFRHETLQGKRGFSRFQDVRSIEELFHRPDIPQPLVRRGGNGISRRLDTYTQKERTQAIGNAVVPQVAQFIARRIKELII